MSNNYLVRDTAGRFRKQATVYITKKLQKQADAIKKEILDDVEEHLLEIHKQNVEATYEPRGDGSYIYTGHLVESIIAERDDNTVKIVIDPSAEPYPNGRTVEEVYDYLRKGTNPAVDKQKYVYQDEKMDVPAWAHNWATPAHPFEQHTVEQMKGYMHDLESKYSRKGHSR